MIGNNDHYCLISYWYRDENAPKEIEDVNAKKPSDWDETEEELIADPEATKPGNLQYIIRSAIFML